MKVLVIGGGGREHALVWKIARSPIVKKIFCAPGNAGISHEAECVSIRAEDIAGLADFAAKEKIDLTVVGPELPLSKGIADRFREKGLAIFGPSQGAAEIEASKVFAKSLMEKYGIPTPRARIFTGREDALRYARSTKPPLVVKADGLASGKGVIVANTADEACAAVEDMMGKKVFGQAGAKVIIEECLQGREVSALAFSDGERILPLPLAKDHKRVGDGDAGPNTGGMGAFSPVPFVDSKTESKIHQEILLPVVRAMEREERPYRGVLYAGLMFTSDGPSVLEFNCRFGDPETQPIFCLLEEDIVPILVACSEGRLGEKNVVHKVGGTSSAACVVMASRGYPGAYDKGFPISGLEEAASLDGVKVFHAGTSMKDGRFVTAGGRVLGVTGRGDTLSQALSRAYAAVGKISWDGVHYRKDIGYRP